MSRQEALAKALKLKSEACSDRPAVMEPWTSTLRRVLGDMEKAKVNPGPEMLTEIQEIRKHIDRVLELNDQSGTAVAIETKAEHHVRHTSRGLKKRSGKLQAWELEQRQSLDLDQKISLSRKRIEEWIDAWDHNVYVSLSGGNDSAVLADLVKTVYKRCPLVFVDTGMEYPEIRRFARSQQNVIVLHPKMHFHEVIEKYGYPVVSKRVSRFVQDLRGDPTRNPATRNLRLTGMTQAGNYCPNLKLPEKWRFLVDAPFKISDRCCSILKEGPLDKYARETGRKPITGEMANDSQARRWVYLQTGCNAFDQNDPRSRPLGFWTNQDILQYIKEKNLPYCSEVYGEIVEVEGKLRCTKASHTGCMFCGFGVQRDKNDRFAELKVQHPKLYNYGMHKLGMLEVIEYVNYASHALNTYDP